MKYTVEEVSQVIRKINVEVPAENVREIRQKALKKVQRQARFKGFRLGKAPLSLVESNYGAQIDMDSVEDVLNNYFPQALRESGLAPLCSPKFDFASLDMDNDFSFSAEFEVRPVFDVAAEAYKGLELKEPDLQVTDKVMDDTLKQVLETKATFSTISEQRATRMGDTVLVDYQTFDGQESLDPPITDAPMDLSPGVLLSAIEQALQGRNVGEKFEAEVEFDDNARTEHYRNKKVRFAMEVKGIQEKHLPELTDEFVKQNWPMHSGVEALRESLRKSLAERYEKQKNETMRQQIIRKIHKMVDFEVPPSLVDAEQKRMAKRFLDYMQQDGIGSLPGMDEQSLMNEVEDEARFKIKAGLTLARIGEQENIEVTDEDVEKELQRQAGDRPLSEMRAFVEKNNLMPMIMDNLLEDKILQAIKDAASIIKVDAEQLDAELAAEQKAELEAQEAAKKAEQPADGDKA